MSTAEKKKTKKRSEQKKIPGRQIETESDGKLSPAEAEAIMSSDLPSGDPELTPPAQSGDQSPDYPKRKAA